MNQHSLQAKKRLVSGKKVKKLRAAGDIPATIYGKEVTNTLVSVNKTELKSLVKEAGESGVVSLIIENETRPVLIHALQRHPTTNEILHIEFLQVNLREKVKTRVPLKTEGEPPAVKEKLGVLLQLLNDVEVEALPNDIPDAIIVNVGGLTAVGSEIAVSNLLAPSGVTIITDSNIGVCRIGELAKEETVAPPAPTENAGETSQPEDDTKTQPQETVGPGSETA